MMRETIVFVAAYVAVTLLRTWTGMSSNVRERLRAAWRLDKRRAAVAFIGGFLFMGAAPVMNLYYGARSFARKLRGGVR